MGTLLGSGPEDISRVWDPFLVLDPQRPETLQETQTESVSAGDPPSGPPNAAGQEPLSTTCSHSPVVSAWGVPGPLSEPSSVPTS